MTLVPFACAVALVFAQNPSDGVHGVVAPKLPAPSGPAAVGTVVLHFEVRERPDPSDPKRRRPIVVQLWYPAKPAVGSRRVAYAPDQGLVDAMEVAHYFEQESSVFDSWSDVVTHAIFEPTAASDAPLPLLLLSHGAGLSRINYTTIAEDLASHGYAVAAIDHACAGIEVLPDGRVLTIDKDPAFRDDGDGWERLAIECARDATAVLDELTRLATGKYRSPIIHCLDLKRVGMLGHSLGGTAALVAANRDDRIVACANLDGGPSKTSTAEGVKRPTLVLLNSPIYSDEELAKKGRTKEGDAKAGKERQEMWDRVFAVKGQPFWVVRVLGTGHMSFTDAPFVMPTTITRFGGRILEPARTLEVVSAVVRAFFDQEIRGVKSELLAGASNGFPELEVRRRGK